jgi:hypothetical protein
LQFEKEYFLYCSFLVVSFGFAFQKWFVELDKVLLQHFKSLKMEENWERFVKVFNDRLMFSDKCIYPTLHPRHVHSKVEN